MKLEEIYPDRIIDRGEGYIHCVNYCIKIGKHLYSEVEGTFTYKTKINLKPLLEKLFLLDYDAATKLIKEKKQKMQRIVQKMK
jgi:hypothetical protein